MAVFSLEQSTCEHFYLIREMFVKYLPVTSWGRWQLAIAKGALDFNKKKVSKNE
jgi:hypothetical protein